MLTRRELLQLAAVSPALAAAGSPALLSVFDYPRWNCSTALCAASSITNHAFFLHLDDDRMLKIYRQRVGMPAPGADMGGWYDDFCPGAHFGQYVSALARFAGATDSEATRAKVQAAGSRLCRNAGSIRQVLRGSALSGLHVRQAGVRACWMRYSYAGDATALDVLAETTRAAMPHMADRALTSEEMHQRPHKDETYTWDETYTFAENLFMAYDRTGDRKYYDLGKRYLLDKGFFDPLAEGQNVLPGLHAYSHVNALSSGIQGYLKLGDAKYFRAVRNAVDMILKDQSYATGGWGPNEAFVQPGKGELGDSLRATHRHFESGCGAYSHFKLMRYLLALTRESRYGDSMERVLYNVALGIQPILEDGSTFYYSDYHPPPARATSASFRTRSIAGTRMTGGPAAPERFRRLRRIMESAPIFAAPDGIYVNLYVPSRVSWKQGATRCSILQETDYPAGNEVTLTMTAPPSRRIYGLSANSGVGWKRHHRFGERPPRPRGNWRRAFFRSAGNGRPATRSSSRSTRPCGTSRWTRRTPTRSRCCADRR